MTIDVGDQILDKCGARSILNRSAIQQKIEPVLIRGVLKNRLHRFFPLRDRNGLPAINNQDPSLGRINAVRKGETFFHEVLYSKPKCGLRKYFPLPLRLFPLSRSILFRRDLVFFGTLVELVLAVRSVENHMLAFVFRTKNQAPCFAADRAHIIHGLACKAASSKRKGQ